MTRKIQNELDAERALRILYGDGLRDFSPSGYLKAMGELRKADPTLARRVERFLAPKLDEIFPRRRRPWHETSEGVRARLELLPSNPHCELDVHAAREALGIPPDQIKASPSESDVSKIREAHGIPPDQIKASPSESDSSKIEASPSPEDIRRTMERHLAGLWVYLHTAIAKGDAAAVDLISDLPQALQESAIASASVKLKNATAEWLRGPPQGPAPFDDSSAPIYQVAGRLTERYRLPWKVGYQMVWYVLTQDSSWVTGLDPLHVDVIHQDSSSYSSDPEAFTVAVKGIDEFATMRDWDRIWNEYVMPYREELMKTRGGTARGRSRSSSRYKVAIFIYRDMVRDSLSIGDAFERAKTGLDQETIRRTIDELQLLMRPEP